MPSTDRLRKTIESLAVPARHDRAIREKMTQFAKNLRFLTDQFKGLSDSEAEQVRARMIDRGLLPKLEKVYEDLGRMPEPLCSGMRMTIRLLEGMVSTSAEDDSIEVPITPSMLNAFAEVVSETRK